MQLDILRELDTNGFECTDSDTQEGNPPLVPPSPRPPPPPPLAINKRYVINIFVLFQAVIQGGKSREVPKSCSNTLILE